jgi:peptidoglycan/LPS O-acetylase OafA/YrhL
MNRYFPALDILRLAAAMLVMLGHVELILNYRWMEGFMPDSLLYETGKAGVAMFFALSGFLLAKISMEQRENAAGFGVKQFLKNRALRILPLYYFLMVIAFFLLSRFDVLYVEKQTEELREFLLQKFMLYFFLLPQFNTIFFKEHVPVILQFWTVGSEVLFYILLPFLILAKKPLQLMISVFVAFVISKFALQLLLGKTPFEGGIAALYKIMVLNRIDCMLIGAIAALLLHQKHKWAATLSSKDNMIFGTGLVVIMLVMHRRIINGFDYALYAAAIVPYLLYFTLPERKIEGGMLLKAMAFGGKISYSIYLTHFMVLMGVWHLISHYSTFAGSEFAALFYVLGIASVLVVSAITYQFIELPFLNMKKKRVR